MKMSDRDRVLRAFEQPRQPRSANGNIAAGPGDRITVRTDLPPKMKRERGRLASVAYKLRKTQQLKTKIVIHDNADICNAQTFPSKGCSRRSQG